MADQMAETLAEMKSELSLIQTQLRRMAHETMASYEVIGRLHDALEKIADVPNHTASHSRALSQIVKIATEAVENRSRIAQ